MRLSKPRASRLLSLTGAPTPGSGVDLPRILATIAASIRIAFKERSTRLALWDEADEDQQARSLGEHLLRLGMMRTPLPHMGRFLISRM
jgi:hypothetical protein